MEGFFSLLLKIMLWTWQTLCYLPPTCIHIALTIIIIDSLWNLYLIFLKPLENYVSNASFHYNIVICCCCCCWCLHYQLQLIPLVISLSKVEGASLAVRCWMTLTSPWHLRRSKGQLKKTLQFSCHILYFSQSIKCFGAQRFSVRLWICELVFHKKYLYL